MEEEEEQEKRDEQKGCPCEEKASLSHTHKVEKKRPSVNSSEKEEPLLVDQAENLFAELRQIPAVTLDGVVVQRCRGPVDDNHAPTGVEGQSGEG